MMNKASYSNTQTQTNAGNTLSISINDLRQKELNGKALSLKELMAIRNFENHKNSLLNSISNPQELDVRYKQLMVMAKTAHFEEFLASKYF